MQAIMKVLSGRQAFKQRRSNKPKRSSSGAVISRQVFKQRHSSKHDVYSDHKSGKIMITATGVAAYRHMTTNGKSVLSKAN